MGQPDPRQRSLPSLVRWTVPGRVVVFVLAATSIWCLLAEMYGLVDMRRFFHAILLPATAALYGMAVLDRGVGDRRLWRAVMIGTAGGLVGAAAYDVFRMPFVFSHAWGLERLGIPQMALYKVFPSFGALILGQPKDQPSYTLAAHLLGWAYHFSNGATFGVMFAALALGSGDGGGAPRRGRIVLGAVAMAAGVEACLLISPYTRFFALPVTARFVVVTLAAHIIFGIALGLFFGWLARRWKHACAVPCTMGAAGGSIAPGPRPNADL